MHVSDERVSRTSEFEFFLRISSLNESFEHVEQCVYVCMANHVHKMNACKRAKKSEE